MSLYIFLQYQSFLELDSKAPTEQHLLDQLFIFFSVDQMFLCV